MTTHKASSSSSSKSKLWNYDVFLSFSGVDTRNGFTDHLHAALTDRGYQAYIDDNDLKRGEEIQKELEQAIEKSKISIIVFSKRYADSSWCLNELVKIMECRDKLGRHVLPIFYHIDPSHVRKQNGVLAQAFTKHRKNIRKEKDDKKREEKRERVKQWRRALREAAKLAEEFQKHEEGIGEEKDDKKREAKQEGVKHWAEALTKAANLSGYHLQITDNRRDEAKLIREIVDKIIPEWLPSAEKLHVAKHPVGIYTRIQDIITYISNGGSDDVRMVGIWGMGGLGKTTVAKAVYNQIHHKFQFKSFLANVSEHNLVDLQGKLVSDILKQPESKTTCVDEGINLIKNHLQHRSVLVIIDNVDKVEQLNAIVGNRDWFGPGSRIIITTRDECLLKQVDKTYPLQEMNEEEALKLFSWHAFGNSWPDEGYLELSKEVVSYCGGLPLALEVLGSFLIKRTIAEWESQLEKLKTTPEGKIIKPLRISFEGLDDAQKAIFLDISCFFVGWDKDFVAKILDGCKFFPTIGISVLCERCLITVEDNKLNMHDLLREMAKVIISGNSRPPGEWSRLWNRQEVIDVLRENSGTKEVEGLALNLTSEEYSCFSTEAFANMKKLRLLKLSNVRLNGEYKHFPKELIWLCWEGCPLKSIPDDFFDQPKLVVLEISPSNNFDELVWKGSKSLKNLKILNLRDFGNLAESPDFSNLPNLEELRMRWCWGSFEIHPSICHLKKLSLVDLSFCGYLESLPGDFYRSESIQTLILDGCCGLSELPEDLWNMISLRVLKVSRTAIRRVPRSIVRLKNLTHLSIAEMLPRPHVKLSESPLQLPDSLNGLDSLRKLNLSMNDFHTLPSLSDLSKLEVLKLNECSQLRAINDLPTNLKFLYASDCSCLVTMPNFSKMLNMRELIVRNSSALTDVLDLDKSLKSMTLIDMRGCPKLTADFMRNVLKEWTSCGYGGIYLDGDYVPDWFEFVNNGNKVSFDIPPSDGRNFEGLTLLCFYHSEPYWPIFDDAWINDHPRANIDINNNNHTELLTCIGKEDWVTKMGDVVFEKCFLWQGQISNDKPNLQSGDKVDITFEMPEGYQKFCNGAIKGIGVNLVWDKPMKENIHYFIRGGRLRPRW